MGLLTKPNELTMKETYAGLIYGQPGTGKTTLALSGVNPVCIDVDRGMYRVEKRYQVPSLQVESYQQVLDLLNSRELDEFETIVIDTLGKLIDRMGEYVAKNNPKYRLSNGQLSQQGWGQIKIEFRALVKLINGKNKSVIFVAHETEEREDDVTKKRPDVSGSARKDIVKELDFMGYMEMSGSKRTISFAPSGACYAKNSMGLDSVIEIPGIQTGNTFIKDVIVAAIRNRREQDREQSGLYDETVTQIDGLIDAAKDITALNEAYEKLAALNHIWDSKLYAWSKIREAAKALNGTWDKAAKRFIGPAAPVSKPEAPEDGRSQTAQGADTALKNIEQQCLDKAADITEVMAGFSETGERYFTDDEVKAVNLKLSDFSRTPPELRLNLISKLLDAQTNTLRERAKIFADAGFGKYPALKPEAAGETKDDGFVDDIPIERRKAAKAKVPAAAETGEELGIF
ncbi:MAG: ATP-binding protein [Spirochaetaceae bacterium]|jgi:hypothetical protein|nr:ATP-binding protein [Spirochaetaceae bacterium]